jgi:hypothetical protein
VNSSATPIRTARETPPRPIELLAVVVAAVATAKDAPALVRLTGIPRLIRQHLGIGSGWTSVNKDTFLFWLYIVVFSSLLLWTLLRKITVPKEEESDESRFKRAMGTLPRTRWIQIVRSFGFVLLREWILGMMGVANYGTFLRSKQDWAPAPERFDSVDRIYRKNDGGVEFQYQRGHRFVVSRGYGASDNGKYGPEQIRPPTWPEIGLLLVASNFFPWWFIIHGPKRLYDFCRGGLIRT